MPFDGNGIYELPATTVTPAVAGTTIDDSEFNTFTADLTTALTLCIAKDGQTSSPTLTNPKILTKIIDTNGNELQEFGTTASAVNHLKVTNAATTSRPTISTAGEADIGIDFETSEGEEILQLFPAVSAVNNIVIASAATGQRPVIRSIGEADIGVTFSNPDGEEMLTLLSDITAVNYAAITSAATGSAPSVRALGDDTNIDLRLAGKGAGNVVIDGGVSGTAGVSRMIQETAVATTSGTTVDFTSIPSWVKEVSVILDQVSSDAVTTDFICQIGDSGGLETTNYSYTVSTSKVASIVTASNTADSSIHVTSLTPAASHCNGEVKIINVNSNVWEFSGLLSDPVSNELYSIAGRKSLSGTLDRLRFSLTSGSFDAGQVNIIYKG